MPASPADIFAKLDALNAVYRTVEHPPVFTVEEAQAHPTGFDGAETKNFFLKDARGQLWLVVLPAEGRTDLKALAGVLDAKKFSFGSAELLEATLGIRPGSVSPFSLINDPGKTVKFALSAELAKAPKLTFHPLTNTMTTEIATADFLRWVDREPVVFSL